MEKVIVLLRGISVGGCELELGTILSAPVFLYKGHNLVVRGGRIEIQNSTKFYSELKILTSSKHKFLVHSRINKIYFDGRSYRTNPPRGCNAEDGMIQGVYHRAHRDLDLVTYIADESKEFY